MSQAESLIMKHQDYVGALAREIHKKLPSQADYEELVAYGQVGLVEAANNYDASRGIAFTTFSYYRIRGAIFDGVRKMTWLPPATRKKMTVESGKNEAIQQTADAPDTDDPEILAKRFADAVARLGAVMLLSSAGDDDQPLDNVDDQTPDQGVEDREMIARIKEAVDELPEDQAVVMRLHYFEQKSMTEIAKELNKNKSTVSRRHMAAVDALREMLTPSADRVDSS